MGELFGGKTVPGVGFQKKNKYISTTELEQPLLGDVMQRRFSYPWNCFLCGGGGGAGCRCELWFGGIVVCV